MIFMKFFARSSRATSIAPDRSRFTIRDEGEGFDWKSRIAAQPNEPGLHGMGMIMARLYVQNMGYNESGNEVSFEIEHTARFGDISLVSATELIEGPGRL